MNGRELRCPKAILATVLEYPTDFPATATQLQFDELPVGDYDLNLSVIDTASGNEVLSGYGNATIEEGKAAHANIFVGPQGNVTGSLIVTIVYNEPNPIDIPCYAWPVPMYGTSDDVEVANEAVAYPDCSYESLPPSEGQTSEEVPGCSDCTVETP